MQMEMEAGGTPLFFDLFVASMYYHRLSSWSQLTYIAVVNHLVSTCRLRYLGDSPADLL